MNMDEVAKKDVIATNFKGTMLATFKILDKGFVVVHWTCISILLCYVSIFGFFILLKNDCYSEYSHGSVV